MWERWTVVVGVLDLVGPAVVTSASAKPDWTSPVVLPLPIGTLSGFANGGVEFAVRTDVTMPIDLNNVSTRLVVSRRGPGGAPIDQGTLTLTSTAVPLSGVLAVAPS